jgi:hypothetical protein
MFAWLTGVGPRVSTVCLLWPPNMRFLSMMCALNVGYLKCALKHLSFIIIIIIIILIGLCTPNTCTDMTLTCPTGGHAHADELDPGGRAHPPADESLLGWQGSPWQGATLWEQAPAGQKVRRGEAVGAAAGRPLARPVPRQPQVNTQMYSTQFINSSSLREIYRLFYIRLYRILWVSTRTYSLCMVNVLNS